VEIVPERGRQHGKNCNDRAEFSDVKLSNNR